MDDPSAWRAADYAGREDEWLAPLMPSDIAELDAAVYAIEAHPKLRQEVRAEHLYLPGRGDVWRCSSEMKAGGGQQ